MIQLSLLTTARCIRSPVVARIADHTGCQCPSWSSKVDDFHFTWKGVCHFLLMTNSNLGRISHRFQGMISFSWNPLQVNPQFENVPLELHCVPKKTSLTFLTVTWKPIINYYYFGTNILDTTSIKWLFSFPPHPMYASALPRESRASEICVEINKKPEKKHPRHYRS